MKLGKLAPRHDSRTLKIARYLKASALPKIPASVDWTAKVATWPMMLNDTLGDCTCAAAGHMVELWTANAGDEITLTNAAILSAYKAVSGYNPATGANDNGAVELDVLNYWKKTGFGGRKISAYVALSPGNLTHVRASVFILGGTYIGLALPLSAQSQSIWDVPARGAHGNGSPGSWGGHAVPVVAYDADGLTVVTWGALKRMTWDFWKAYCDEAYGILSPDWLNAKKIAANGFNVAQLKADLKKI